MPAVKQSGESPHQSCHRLAKVVNIIGAFSLLFLLALDLALSLAAVHVFVSSGRLIAFVNAAGPNSM